MNLVRTYSLKGNGFEIAHTEKNIGSSKKLFGRWTVAAFESGNVLWTGK